MKFLQINDTIITTEKKKKEMAMKRSSSYMELFRELPFGARQYAKYSELILELCA